MRRQSSLRREVVVLASSGSDLAIAKSKPHKKATVQGERVPPPRPAPKQTAKTEALCPAQSMQSKIPKPTKVVAASKANALSYQDRPAHDIDGGSDP